MKKYTKEYPIKFRTPRADPRHECGDRRAGRMQFKVLIFDELGTQNVSKIIYRGGRVDSYSTSREAFIVFDMKKEHDRRTVREIVQLSLEADNTLGYVLLPIRAA